MQNSKEQREVLTLRTMLLCGTLSFCACDRWNKLTIAQERNSRVRFQGRNPSEVKAQKEIEKQIPHGRARMSAPKSERAEQRYGRRGGDMDERRTRSSIFVLQQIKFVISLRTPIDPPMITPALSSTLNKDNVLSKPLK